MRCGFDPWVMKIPGGGRGNPLQYSCLERTPRTEEPGGLRSMGLQRVRHDGKNCTHAQTQGVADRGRITFGDTCDFTEGKTESRCVRHRVGI